MLRAHLLLASVAVMLAGCSGAPEEAPRADPFAADPLVAAALHDGLMSDPDLSARNEANAVLGFADDTALPLLPATPAAARAAREAGRLELIAEGPIPALPKPVAGRGPLASPVAGAREALAALDAPASCLGRLTEDFRWAAALPRAAAIMPHGMVVQAVGAAAPGCDLRIIRYQTAAPPEDALQYHYVRARRAGLAAQRFAASFETIAGRGARGERLVAMVGRVASGLTAVTLLYRAPDNRP
jgi:hypothetical protein